MRKLAAVLLLAAAAATILGSGARLERLEATSSPAQHLLYLPNGRYLRMACLGNDLLVADLIYLWSIQYYASFQVEDRYEYVDHIYAGIITELDPHYFDPYWLGALILSVETHDLDKAIALLDKGFAKNPDQWIYPYMAGWEYAYAKRYDKAILYFRKAAAVPSAPPDVVRLPAGMYQKEGDKKTALAEWRRIAVESKDAGVRKLAENRVRALTGEVDRETLTAAIATFRQARGRAPGSLQDLVRAGLIPFVPTDPDGAPYSYDPASGSIGSGPVSVLPR